MLKNMKIGNRLAIGMSVIVLLILFLGIQGVQALKNINVATDMLARVRLPNVQKSYILKENIASNTMAVQNMMLTDDPNIAASSIAQIKEVTKTAGPIIKQLQDAIQTPEGQAAFKQYEEARTPYKASQVKLMGFIKNHQLDQARALWFGESMALQQAFLKSLDHFIDFQSAKINQAAQAAQDQYTSSRNRAIVLISIIVILSILLTVLLVRSISIPLKEAVLVANHLSQGNLEVTIETNAKDETGQLLVAMRNMVTKLSSVITDVKSSANTLASSSEQINSTSQSLSQAASEQAATVEETSASMEQMAASVAQNTDNAKVTDGMAQKAARQATEGGSAVTETVSAMKAIASKISVVDDIAYQTNLLALNAAIEAARAGEHGKGFAVVAAEVRKLAERSQTAAAEIGELASSSVQKAELAGKLLDEMVPAINKTSELVQEITASSQEQSAGVGQINAAINQLNQVTQQNASASEELAATAEEMSAQAEQLQQAISFFKIGSTGVTSAPAPRKPDTAVKTFINLPAKQRKVSGTDVVPQVSDAEFVKF